MMLWALANRTLLDLNVLPDRNPYYVRLSNGDIRNGFTVKILNKLHEPRDFKVAIQGLPNATLRIAGTPVGQNTVQVPTDSLREFRIFIVVPKNQVSRFKDHDESFTFTATDIDSGRITRQMSRFRRPTQ